ncbi:porin [Thalassotalea sp. PLHSN55]|uniref:porin n=1 Tax=Thalassotalea sp. PLHSN55 TaxID=3435888 RepID=UPI003F8411EA
MINTKWKLTAAAVAAACMLTPAQAVELYNDGKTKFNVNGDLSVFYLKSDGVSEVGDGFSRFMFDMSREFDNGWTGFGKIEQGIALSNTDNKLIVNRNGLTSTGPSGDHTWLRQGYVGIANDTYGSFSMGKMFSVGYKVTGGTDIFEIFGSQAAGIYNFGTDGGFSGTGRAEQAIQYNLDWNKFSFGLQFTASGDNQIDVNDNEETGPSATVNYSDSYSWSVLYSPLEKVKVGVAYNKANVEFNEDLQHLVEVAEVEDEMTSASITYGSYHNRGLYMSWVFSDMKNHEINDEGKLMTEAFGSELYASYRFEGPWALVGGYNSLKDNSVATNGSNESNYHLKYAIVGVNYFFDDDFYLYSEAKINDSESSTGSDYDENAIGFGIKYNF